MIAEVTRKPHQDDSARDKRERAHQENALDEASRILFRRPIRFQSSSRQFKQHSTANAIGIRLAPFNGFNDLIKNGISVCAVLIDLNVHGLTCFPKRPVNSRVELANFESRP